MTNVILPSLGQTTTELTIIRWLKREGDAVQEGDTLLEVQTDKAIVELPATSSGILQGILFDEGALVEAGTVLAKIVSPNELAAIPAPPPTPAPTQPTPANTPPLLSESVRVATARTQALKATPLARATAHSQGIDLALVRGTGPAGTIKRADVLQWAAAQLTAVAQASEPMRRRPLSPMRQTIAKRMLASKQTIPHYYVTVHVDATELVHLRAELKNDSANAPSLNSFLLRASANALRSFPDVNASIDGDSYLLHDEIHIGFAVEVKDGLLVPVVRHADRLDILKLTTTIDELVERTRHGRLTSAELSGAHFSISNLGMFGADEFSAIINPPEAAILAVGRIRPNWMGKGDAPVLGSTLTLTLSVDHRIVDGALAARFIHAIADDLEHPYRLLLPIAASA